MQFPLSTPLSAESLVSSLSPEFVDVALYLPLDRIFTYRVPKSLQREIKLGQRLLVPFGRRKMTGHVLKLTTLDEVETRFKGKKAPQLKDVISILDPEPLIPGSLLQFLSWIAAYYQTPLGEVLHAAIPAGIDLKSLRQVRLTALGQNSFDPQHIDSPTDHLLKQLTDKGALSTARLKKLSGVTEGLLKRLEQKGYLAIDHTLSKVRVKMRTERFVRLAKAPEKVLKGKKQAGIIELLKDGKEFSLSDLEEKIGGTAAAVRKLAELGLVALEEREVYRDPFAIDDESPREFGDLDDLKLTSEQEKAVSAIQNALTEKRFSTFLLHGVTGSGKTEVYVRSVHAALQEGREAIVLVPEIALTSQVVALFRWHFGDQIAVIHSHLSDGERYDQWRRILKGEVKIVVGARSALFAPFTNLGLIIVDEEHETSFKQEKGFLYHARDLAIARARFSKAVAILGSATPSLESSYNAETKKFKLLTLEKRIGDRPLPEVEIIDLKKEALVYRQHEKTQPILTKKLLDAITETLEAKEQVILLLNRRGYAPNMLCHECGQCVQCSHCAISLTYYQKAGLLKCHYCDHSEPVPQICPHCKAEGIKLLGFGTESLEEEIIFHFPEARIARMDRDTTGQKGAHHRIIRDVEDGKIDILLGTQMIAKGLHFPRVTLVGVVSADVALNMPDFRASERTFQLLTQVAGRAGRGERPGKVLIQTYNPGHYAITCAKNHDFHGFQTAELETRSEMSYPPFSRLICFKFKDPQEKACIKAGDILRKRSDELLQSAPKFIESIIALGPAPAPLSRLKGNYRWHFLLKSASPKILHEFCLRLRQKLVLEPAFQHLRLAVDVDPMNLL